VAILEAMNQPALAPVVDQSRQRRQRWMTILAVVGASLLLGGGAFGFYSLVSGFIQRAAVKPWEVLLQAKTAVQTEAGAQSFYRAHPGLAKRFPTQAAFLAASRDWAPKLAQLPATAPDLWTMLKSGGGNMNVNSVNSRTTFSLTGFRGVSVEVVTEDNRLIDLQVD
jgi:hypothetical protein